MKMEQPLSSEILNIDLAFTSDIPLKIKNQINQESINLLKDSDFWRLTLTKWISFIRKNPKLTCPESVRRNNYLSLGLVFTDDLVISELNKEWRNKNLPTDVLSFAALEGDYVQPEIAALELGDIFVSVETAFKQASFYNQSLAQELSWLVSHGTLHLLGWDHSCSESLSKMLTLQEELIKMQKNRTSYKCVKPN